MEQTIKIGGILGVVVLLVLVWWVWSSYEASEVDTFIAPVIVEPESAQGDTEMPVVAPEVVSDDFVGNVVDELVAPLVKGIQTPGV